MNKHLILICLSVVISILLFSQAFSLTAAPNSESTPPDIRKSYGVWDRSGDYSNEQFPFLKGTAISIKWSDFESQKGQYNWELINTILQKTAQSNQYVYLQLNIGPDSPEWIYENGVPKVEVNAIEQNNGSEEKFSNYPYYLSPSYLQLLNNTITAIGDYVYAIENQAFDRIAFIQVVTGCTGDEVAYKGTPIDSKFKIDDEQWQAYRLQVFEMYKQNFQRPSGSKYLLFNDVDQAQFPEEYDWVMNNINYIGQKGYVLPRGYDSTNMASFVNEVRNNTFHSPDRVILSRAEMDQTWSKGFFMLNLPMNVYWSTLNALHGGLGVWDVSASILDEKKNPNLKKIIPYFEFFNLYAGDIVPETAKGGFIAFHKGLDVSDTLSYPEKKFGIAKQDNQKRYLAICRAYSAYGARMDDVKGATLGQVKQRDQLKGFNDCGWDIPNSNYERFITQIEPDKTDQPLWRVGGKITKTSPAYSRFARSFSSKHKKNAIYLNVDDRFYNSKSNSNENSFEVKIIYLDQGKGSFSLVYDAKDNPQKTAVNIKKGNSRLWKEKIVTIEDAAFLNRGTKASDLSLVNTDSENDIFHMVEIRKIQ